MRTLARPLLVLALFLPAITPAIASGEPNSDRRIITVRGQDVVRIAATRARLTAMIEMQAESPAAAQQAVRERSRTVLAFLERSRVDRLQAGAMALHPVYDHRRSQFPGTPDGPPQVVAYRAQWSASFEIDAARAGEMADGIVEAGVARIASFEFTATDEALASAQQAALRGAAQRAREDAHAVLEALGYRPGEVVRIELNSTGPAQPFYRRAEMTMAADAGGSTAVEPGLIEVNGSVALEVAY